MICTCGRPKCTGYDLERWFLELATFESNCGASRMFNPEWARAICWIRSDAQYPTCPMRKLEPTT